MGRPTADLSPSTTSSTRSRLISWPGSASSSSTSNSVPSSTVYCLPPVSMTAYMGPQEGGRGGAAPQVHDTKTPPGRPRRELGVYGSGPASSNASWRPTPPNPERLRREYRNGGLHELCRGPARIEDAVQVQPGNIHRRVYGGHGGNIALVPGELQAGRREDPPGCEEAKRRSWWPGQVAAVVGIGEQERVRFRRQDGQRRRAGREKVGQSNDGAGRDDKVDAGNLVEGARRTARVLSGFEAKAQERWRIQGDRELPVQRAGSIT